MGRRETADRPPSVASAESRRGYVRVRNRIPRGPEQAAGKRWLATSRDLSRQSSRPSTGHRCFAAASSTSISVSNSASETCGRR